MSKGRVLVVDDEADVRKSVRLILTKAGYDVDEAEDPEAGVALVKSGTNKLPLECDYYRSQYAEDKRGHRGPLFAFPVPVLSDRCAERIKNDG